MTKSLQEIQQENRKFILEAIHGCSYEEALKKELVFGCKVIDKKHLFFGVLDPVEMILVYDYKENDNNNTDFVYFLHLRGNPLVRFFKQDIFDKNKFEIIGKPITLSRVLLAFKIRDVKKNGNGIVFNYDWGNFSSLDENKHGYCFIPYIFCHLFYWDLTKETLEEQSEETQRGINKLFND